MLMFSHVQLPVTPMDHGPPGFSVLRILQARILEWVAISSPGDLPDPMIKPMSLIAPALAGRFFTSSTWEAILYITILKMFSTLLLQIDKNN